jgi:prepilin-type N-terminal cleavage/methylation domain-containing protein
VTTRAPEHGFTLLEVVVAMTILAAGIVGLMALLRGSITLSGGARDVTTASTFASQRLEEALLLPKPAREETGRFGEGNDKFSWTVSAETLPAEGELPIEGHRFRVTVRWEDGGQSRSVSVASDRWQRKAGIGG